MNEDAVLVERAQQGDQDAFAELYERYFDRLYDFLARLVRNDAEAADLAQDTFLKAMNSLSTLTKGASFKSWLFTIARNNALNRLERSSRSQPLETENDEGDQLQYDPVDTDRLGNPEEAAEAENMAALVWEAARGLDPKSYSVLHLTLREGLESAEIADVLGVTKNNAYVMVNRMKQALEDSVGALMLLRNGRRECSELDAVLARLEIAEMSPDTRRAISHHASSCENCRDRRAKMASPFAIFAGLPLLQPADGVKEGIFSNLGNAFAQAHGGAGQSSNDSGGPAIDSSSDGSSGPESTAGPNSSSLDTPFSEGADSWKPAGGSTGDAISPSPLVTIASPRDDENSGRRRKVLAGVAAVALLLIGSLGAIALSAGGDAYTGENQNLFLVLSPTLPPTSAVVKATATPMLPTPDPEVTPINSEVDPELPIAPGGSTPPTPRPQPPLTAATTTPAAGGPIGDSGNGLVAPSELTSTPTVRPSDTPVPLPTATPTATVTRTRTPTPSVTPCVATMSASPGSITFTSFPQSRTVTLSVTGCGGPVTFTASVPTGYNVIPASGSVAVGGSQNLTIERLTPSASHGTLVINPSVGANLNVTIDAP